jgi:hypothetical protein
MMEKEGAFVCVFFPMFLTKICNVLNAERVTLRSLILALNERVGLYEGDESASDVNFVSLQ